MRGILTIHPGKFLSLIAMDKTLLCLYPVNSIGHKTFFFLKALMKYSYQILGSGCINKYNATTGAFISNFACNISGPTRIKIGPDGLLYVLQWSGNGNVRRYDLNGTYLGEFTSVGVPQSIGLDWDNKNNLYVSSYNGDLVRRFDTAGNDLGVFVNTNLQGPTNIWFNNNGDLLVSDYDGTAVVRFDSAGSHVGNFMTGLSKSEGVDFLPNGNILIGNGATNSVKMYDSNGNYVNDIIASGSGNLLNPNAVNVRLITSVGINETNTPYNSPIIFPTVGDTFKVNQKYLEKVNELSVYDLSNKLVKKVDIKSQESFSLTDMKEGAYIVKITFKDGEMKSEKIVVKK